MGEQAPKQLDADIAEASGIPEEHEEEFPGFQAD
jgi:hypothetical protein